MLSRNIKWLWLGIACLWVMPAFAQSADRNTYGTYYKDPDNIQLGTENYTDNGRYKNVPPEALQRRQEVDRRLDAAMGRNQPEENLVADGFRYSPQTAEIIKAKAKAGDPRSIGAMGYLYQYGLGVEKNEKAAAQWYERAIDYGQHQYYSSLGDLYRETGQKKEVGFFGQIRKMMGGGDDSAVEKNDVIAREWYEKGMQHAIDDPHVYMRLSMMYRDGKGGLPRDIEKAELYHKNGMVYKQMHNEKIEKELEAVARKRIEQEVLGEEFANADKGKPRPSNMPGQTMAPGQALLMLDGAQCTYARTTSPRKEYSQAFTLSCPRSNTNQAKSDTLRLAGLQCDVARRGDQPYMLLCNVAAETGVRIGDANCALRKEPDMAGYSAVYGAYCNAASQTEVNSIDYLGATCMIEPAASASGKTYTLKCAQAAAASTEQPSSQREVITQRVGPHNCSLQQMESPSSTYKFFYDAYCGGLAENQKTGGAIPGTVAIGVNLCEVEAWPKNDAGKDFELHCR